MDQDSTSKPSAHRLGYWSGCLFLAVLAGFGAWFLVRSFFHGDCAWGATTRFWVDENNNGSWDDGEPPLEGVKLYVDFGPDDVQDNDEWPNATSDWNGGANLDVRLSGCPKVQFEVFAVPPPGYQLTTDGRILVEDPYSGLPDPYYFASVRLPGVPTPTPYVPGLTCKTYNQTIRKMVTAPDGSIWAVSWHGAVKYDPAQGLWRTFTFGDEAPYSADRVTLGKGNVVWLNGLYRRASRLEGSNWVHYTGEESLVTRSTPSIGTTPDGTIWFATRVPHNVLAGFNTQTGSWRLYWGDIVAFGNGPNIPVRLFTDGSVWFAAFDSNSEYPPPDESDALNWIVYDIHTFSDDEIMEMPIKWGIQDAEIAPDGTLWIADSSDILDFDPQADEWKLYNADTTDGSFAHQPHDLAVSPDGSIWIASSSDYPHPLALHLIPASDENDQDIWETYDPRDGIPDATQISNVTVTPDGAVWFGFYDLVARCVLNERSDRNQERGR